MIILITLAILVVIGVTLRIKSEELDTLETTGEIISIFSAVFLIVALVFIPIQQHSSKAEVDRYYALKSSIEKARSGDVSEIERATLAREIIECNKDLASAKYWNRTMFGIYIYDGLAELEFLE